MSRIVGKAEEDSWRVVAASVRGVNHERANQPCQDSNYWCTLEAGILIAAIADGAGSAKLSKIGASLASRVAVDTICKQEPTHALHDINTLNSLLINSVKSARIAIESEALARSAKLQDFACTLIVLIASQELIAIAQIGDGAVVGKKRDGNIITLTSPSFGEYINETTFLTSSEAFDIIQFRVWQQRITHIAAFSDGLQMLALKMPEGAPHLPFFTPLFNFISHTQDREDAQNQLVEFLRSSRVQERTEDDVTLLLAVSI
jgi:hypothetical protein